MTTRRSADHGHEHKAMAPVLKHYGAERVPNGTGHWQKVACPFHDDSIASAQTDGLGFRCFTCDLFFAAPLPLIKDREGGDWNDAHEHYHRIVGEGDSEVRDGAVGSSALFASSRLHASSRTRGTSRRRS